MKRLLILVALVVACKTESKPAVPVDAAPPPSRNEAAITTLRKAIDERYSYRDRLGLNWNAQFAAARPALDAADTPKAFAQAVAALLLVAKDAHIWIQLADGTRLPTLLPPAGNFDRKILMHVVEEPKQLTRCLASGHVGKTAYLAIVSWEHKECATIGADVTAALAAIPPDADGLVIDERMNAGGDENLAKQLAGHFVDHAIIYARSENRTSVVGSGFGPPLDHMLPPIAPRVMLPVAVLMGGRNMSSAELFLLMMRGAGAKLVGEHSLGASGNPQPVDLGNGVTVYLPSWRALLVDGTRFEGVGLTPDLDVKPDFTTRDPILDAAVAALHSHP